MSRIPGVRRFFRHERDDVDTELRFHLECRVDELVRLGVPTEAARRRALSEFGDVKLYHDEIVNIDREHRREVRMKEFVQSVSNDLGYAIRGLRRTPGFAVVAIVTLALGIGATVAVFSAVSGVILRPHSFPNAERIVHLGERETAQPGPGGTTSAENAYDWQRMSTSFSSLGLYSTFSMTLTGIGQAARIDVASVTPGMFDVFGVTPVMGRRIADTDTAVGSPMVAVISHTFWRTNLGADPRVLGRTIQMNFNPVRVVGVLPPGFHGPERLDRPVWLNFINDTLDGRGARSKSVFALLKPRITTTAAQQEMTRIAAQLEELYPRYNKDATVQVTTVAHVVYGDVERPLYLLLGAALLVLLIACANIANLLIARAIGRQREIAMRAALGAGRRRIARQMLTESLVLAILGCAVGIGLAVLAIQNLGRLGPAVFEARPPVIDGRVVLAAIVAIAITTVLCGLLPALRSTNADLFTALRESGRVTAGGGRTRRALTLAQVAIAVVLLTTSGLVTKSLMRVVRVEPGFDTDNLLYGDVWLPRARYDSGRSIAFYAELEERLAATPSVVRVGMASQVPLSGYLDRIGVSDIGGRPELRGSNAPDADRYVVTPAYFRTIGVTLLRGRLLSPEDRYENAPVAVVDEVFARRAFGDDDPIGQTMKLPIRPERATIVGVVRHVKTYGAEQASPGQIYMSNAQYPWRWLSVVVRTSGDPARFAPTLSRVVQSIDPDQPVANITTMDATLARILRDRRFTMRVLAAFAVVAIVLAAVGLYGVIAYGVTQRRRELGVRLALGAQSSELARMVLAEGGRLAVGGAIAGLLVALATGRLLSSLLFEVRANDPLVLGSVTAGLLAVALLACLLPALRATRVNATEVLRGD